MLGQVSVPMLEHQIYHGCYLYPLALEIWECLKFEGWGIYLVLTDIYYNAIINNAAAYLSVSLVKKRGKKNQPS